MTVHAPWVHGLVAFAVFALPAVASAQVTGSGGELDAGRAAPPVALPSGRKHGRHAPRRAAATPIVATLALVLLPGASRTT